LEIPTTRVGWYDVAVELRARLAALAERAPATLRTPCGDLFVAAHSSSPTEPTLNYHPCLSVSGELTVDGTTYTATGGVRASFWDGARGVYATGDHALELLAVARAAWEAYGEHTQMWNLVEAARATGLVDRCTDAVWESPHARDYRVQARAHLLQLGVADLPAPVREVALALLAFGFAGTVQDLRDAATAARSLPVDTQRP